MGGSWSEGTSNSGVEKEEGFSLAQPRRLLGVSGRGLLVGEKN